MWNHPTKIALLLYYVFMLISFYYLLIGYIYGIISQQPSLYGYDMCRKKFLAAIKVHSKDVTLWHCWRDICHSLVVVVVVVLLLGLTVKCWNSHALRIFVATLGKMPLFLAFFLLVGSSSSQPSVPSPLPTLALLASPAKNKIKIS